MQPIDNASTVPMTWAPASTTDIEALLPGVSVLVPAFNEEGAVAREVEELRRVLVGAGIPHEITVVDDGSTDQTAARAVAAGGRVLRHLENRGYGAALKTGIMAARYEMLVITDADGTYPVDRIPDLLEALKASDMAVGARTGANVRIPLIRRPAKWILGLVANLVAGQRIPDLNSGLRAFRRDTVEQYFSVLSNQFSFTTTVTLALLADGYRVTYHPIDYNVRIGKSKITPRHFMDFLILVLRMAMLFQPLRVFLPLAIGFGALGAAKVAFDVSVFAMLSRSQGLERLYAPVLSTSALLLLVIALQLAMVGLVADGVLRRIAQARALVPSRAVRAVETSASTPSAPASSR